MASAFWPRALARARWLAAIWVPQPLVLSADARAPFSPSAFAQLSFLRHRLFHQLTPIKKKLLYHSHYQEGPVVVHPHNPLPPPHSTDSHLHHNTAPYPHNNLAQPHNNLAHLLGTVPIDHNPQYHHLRAGRSHCCNSHLPLRQSCLCLSSRFWILCVWPFFIVNKIICRR